MNVSDNRSVSALFRVFGGAEPSVIADTRALADCRGMNGHEARVLAVIVPVTVLVAIGEWLIHSLGIVTGTLLAVPLTFLALNILPFVLGARTQSMQWFFWLVSCTAWAVSRRQVGGVVGILSHVWLGIAVMNLAAACVLDWRAAMAWKRAGGILWRMALLVTPHVIVLSMGFAYSWPWAILLGSVSAAIFCWAVLNPSCQWLGPVYCSTDFPEILITIDDGPDPHDTPVLLDLLDLHETKAIFFMIGEKVREYPELAREVIRRGHEIGNHTLSHPQASFWCAGPCRTRREISGCQQIIEEVTGIKPRWFRAPVGHRNLFTHPVATDLGLLVMAWNRRGFDAVEKDTGKVLARILPGLTAGDIVLLHESTPIAGEVLGGVLGNIKDRIS